MAVPPYNYAQFSNVCLKHRAGDSRTASPSMRPSFLRHGFIELSTWPFSMGLMTDRRIGVRCAPASLPDMARMAPKPGGKQRC